MKMKNLTSTLAPLFLSLLFFSCGSSTTPSTGRYWNVVMAGASLATVTFGNGISPDRLGVIAAGMSSFYSTGSYNLYITGGSTLGAAGIGCRTQVLAGTTVVEAGARSGTITFAGTCTPLMTSNLFITLGNSTASILDADNNYIVEAGKSVTATITAPASTGSSTGNIAY